MRVHQPGACIRVPISRGDCWESFSCGAYSLGFALVEDALNLFLKEVMN